MPDPITDDINQIANSVASAATTIAKANLWTAIVGFFTALPGLVNIFQQFLQIFKTNPQQTISDIGNAFNLLAQAKTQEDHANASQALASVISKLPS